jgi:hypothetical protein
MVSIEFDAAYGNDRKMVVIRQLSGSGKIYQVFIGNYYEGTIVKLNGEWAAHLNLKSDLTADDIQLLGDIIDNQS